MPVNLAKVKNDDLVFIASGGLTEVGSMNDLNLVFNGRVYKFDAGQAIPGEGEELSKTHFPENIWVPRNSLEMASVVISHGHLDHIGGINYVLNSVIPQGSRPSVMSSSYTKRIAKMVNKSQAEEKNLPSSMDLQTDNYIESVTAGHTKRVNDAEIEFFSVPHSIPGSLGCVVTIAGVRIAYLGDVKLNGETPTTTQHFKRELIETNCDYLLLDATGADREGQAPPEDDAISEVCNIVDNHTRGRVFVTLFSSNTYRTKKIMEHINKNHPGRQIVVSGKSLYRHLEVAGLRAGRDYDAYSWPFETEINDDAVIFVTGANGEEMSTMDRMMNGNVGKLFPTPYDAVVFAASTVPIPENQERVTKLLDRLETTGCTVYASPDVYSEEAENINLRLRPCHASGHAFQEDIKEIVDLTDPKYIIPVHADRKKRESVAHIFADQKTVLLPDSREPLLLS